MPRKKDLKPLLATKHDFVESLDACLNAGMLLYNGVKTAIDMGALTGPAVERIKELCAAYHDATFADTEQ